MISKNCQGCLDYFSHKNAQACTKFCDNRTTVVVQDKGSKGQKTWTFRNTSQKCVCLIEIDGCVFNSTNGKKCDFLLLTCDGTRKLAYLIELKGKDIAQAFSQVYDTLDKLKCELSTFDRHVRIACTSVPNVISTSGKSTKGKIIKLLGGTKKLVYGSSSTSDTL